MRIYMSVEILLGIAIPLTLWIAVFVYERLFERRESIRIFV